ncbi:hypothetical protein [Burkholderia pseudomultivorans]|uniref:hypothetical protein n=1 Tax=Burkholderia pseudomultivorans TaxID=1207504 RepID=UPI000752196D|nr:hypothetical protein [Burkholderia pseudomultivorans]
MAGNFIRVTDAGRAALVAQGNTGTNEHRVTEIGLCTAAFVFNAGMTVMPNEHKRVTTFGGKNVAKDTVHVTIQDTTDDQYSLYGYGLYLENGVLAAVYVQSTPIMEKSPAAYLMLAADMQFVSIDVTKLVFGETSFLNPPASETVQGVIEIATQEEVNAGKDAVRALTPKTAAARYAPLIAPALTGPVTVTSAPDDSDAQLAIKALSGATDRHAKVRLFGTFGGSMSDTGARLAASLRGGFEGGSWGREYFGVLINDGTANDAANDAKQKMVVKVTMAGVQIVGGLSATARPTFGGNLAWDAGNFNPANYLPLAGGVVSGSVVATGSVSGNLANGAAIGTNSGGTLLLANGDAAKDEKKWDVRAAPDSLIFRTIDDAWTTGVPWLTVGRRGNGVKAIAFSMRPTFAGYVAWDAGNFNPADYLSKVQTNAQKIISSLYLDRTGIGGTTSLFIDGDDGQEQVLAFRTAGKHKWLLSCSAAQSNLNLFRYDDNGTNTGSVIVFDRGTGRASFAVRPRFNGFEAWDAGNLDPARFLTLAGASQHATGSYLFEGTIVTTPPEVSGVSLGRNGTLPSLLWRFKDGKPDEKLWDVQAYGSSLQFRVVNDAWSDSSTWMYVLRDGIKVTGINLSVRPQFAGNLAWDAGNFDPNTKLNRAGDTATGDIGVKRTDSNAKGFLWKRPDGTNQAWLHGTNDYTAWATMTPQGGWQQNAILVFNADNRVEMNTLTRFNATAEFRNRVSLGAPGWQADLALGNQRAGVGASWGYIRARDNGGIEIINNAYNAVTWSVDDWGTMYMRGQQILNTDGNLNLTWRGRYLSAEIDDLWGNINARASSGARVQWDSGVNNFGTVDRLGGALPAPWVVCGLSGPGNGTANAIAVYGVLLRNQ